MSSTVSRFIRWKTTRVSFSGSFLNDSATNGNDRILHSLKDSKHSLRMVTFLCLFEFYTSDVDNFVERAGKRVYFVIFLYIVRIQMRILKIEFFEFFDRFM